MKSLYVHVVRRQQTSLEQEECLDPADESYIERVHRCWIVPRLVQSEEWSRLLHGPHSATCMQNNVTFKIVNYRKPENCKERCKEVGVHIRLNSALLYYF